MANELTEFLEAEGGPADADPPDAGAAPALTVEPVSGETPEGQANAKPAAETAAAPLVPPEKVVEPPEEIPEDLKGTREALVAERIKRKDWKGQADRALGELAATKVALEAANLRAAAPPPPPATPAPTVETPPAIVVPNPLEDPQGYHAYQERMRFNERLNISEMMLREQVAAADVDAKLAVFKKAAEANPALRAELSRQQHPYKWAYQQAERIMLLDEIGPDPTAYRTKVEAEIRAKITAEGGGALPALAAEVRLPRSLGTVASSAPRMAAIEEAPEFEDIFVPRPRK